MFHSSQRGQALILLAIGMVGLLGLTALALDGGQTFADRRHAQNTVDNAAYAAGLAWINNQDWDSAGTSIVTANGYNNTNSTHDIIIDTTNVNCPDNAPGAFFTVPMDTTVQTWFAPIVGVTETHNHVEGTAKACKSVNTTGFYGNAVVGLCTTGTTFEAGGTPDWTITGGGILSNNIFDRDGTADITAPSLTSVSGSVTSLNGNGGTIGSVSIGTFPQMTYPPTDVNWPPIPSCNGVATKTGNTWYPETGKEWTGNVIDAGDWAAGGNFAPGLYCVNVSGNLNIHGTISGGDSVTFFITGNNYTIKYNGGGALNTKAPTADDNPYKGVAIYSPLVWPNGGQNLDLRGNGTLLITGSIIMPSARITMFGNSDGGAYRSQVVGCRVDSGGNANVNVDFSAGEQYKYVKPPTIEMVE